MGQIKNIKLHIVTDIKYTLQQQQTLLLRDGQVKEPHSSQPISESSPQWNQETSTQQIPIPQGSRPQVPQKPQVRQEAQQVRDSVTSSGAEDIALLNDFVVDVSCCYRCWEMLFLL